LLIAADHRPTRFVMRTSTGTEVDLHPVHFTGPGPGVQIVPGGKPFLYPTDAFTSGRIAGHLMPCLSAVQQVRFHLGYPRLDRTTTTCGYCATGSASPSRRHPEPPNRTFRLRATSWLDPGLAFVGERLEPVDLDG
jgi:hypothetical protein